MIGGALRAVLILIALAVGVILGNLAEALVAWLGVAP